MTLPEIILICVVFFIGVPAAVKPSHDMRILAFRNWTAAGLVASWAFGWTVYLATARSPEYLAMVLADLTVLAVIYAKPPANDCFPYQTRWHQLCALWIERSVWDRAIILSFIPTWALYAFASPFHQWWGLWWIAIAQFLAAAGEPISDWRKAKRHRRQGESPPAPGLMFAPAWRTWGYG